MNDSSATLSIGKKDFYKMLGVSPSVSQDEVKKAYRKVAMQYHPDRNPGDKEAEESFKGAAEAYEVLGDDEKRAEYDRSLNSFASAVRQNNTPEYSQAFYKEFMAMSGEMRQRNAEYERRMDRHAATENIIKIIAAIAVCSIPIAFMIADSMQTNKQEMLHRKEAPVPAPKPVADTTAQYHPQ